MGYNYLSSRTLMTTSQKIFIYRQDAKFAKKLNNT